MAVSNRTGSLLLSTGNKSELATGYGTLYGDLCGGLSPIADLWKTEVYALAAALNRRANVIPRSSIEKPPSAELRPGQTDQDSLPPYDVLDRILRNVVEHDRGAAELVAAGEDPATVRRLLGLLAKSEFKRRQAPTGLRVSRKAFGSGRNVPIAVSDLDWLSDEPTPPPTR
jgi:NAD+ synthetase